MAQTKSYLVAEFAGFPGVRIPLLSDEELKARGIEKQRLPPFETWTPEQQEAGRKLSEILGQMAVRQAFALVLHHLEQMQVEGYSSFDFEQEAARRALAQLRAGKWKQGRNDTNGLQDSMCSALEAILRDSKQDSDGKIRGRRSRRSNRVNPAAGS
jgi:hypothetical protein